MIVEKLVEVPTIISKNDESCKVAKDEAKPAGSEHLAAGSNSDYKQSVGRWQWALGSKKANTRGKSVKIRHQQVVRNQPLRLVFLNSDFPTAYCLLLSAY